MKKITLLFITILLAVNLQAQTRPYKIGYELTMPNPATHLFEIKMTIETTFPEAAIDLQMPRWSPGRYAVVDFAKGVQEVRASTGCPPNAIDCLSAKLPVSRVDTQTWRITPKKNKRIEVNYKVFANNLSGTFSQLDARQIGRAHV